MTVDYTDPEQDSPHSGSTESHLRNLLAVEQNRRKAAERRAFTELAEQLEQKAREQFCREQGNNPVDDAWYEGRAKGLRDAAEILKGRL